MITPHPSAPLGLVSTLPSYSASDFPPGSAVLCRLNAPLVSHAYGLLKRSIPCRILGRDLGAQLAAIVRKQHAVDLADLSARLSSWHAKESERLFTENKSTERLDDQYSCLCAMIDRLSAVPTATPATLLASIDSLFGESRDFDMKKLVTLASIHKSKGLEWPTVFILDRNLMPSKYATKPEALTQEKNLHYVAVTRSQDRLFYITSSTWKQPSPQ